MEVANLIYKVTDKELLVRGRVYRNTCEFDRHDARFDLITGKPSERTEFALAVMRVREARKIWKRANRDRTAA